MQHPIFKAIRKVRSEGCSLWANRLAAVFTVVLIASTLVPAQSVQPVYSGLQEATSLYATPNTLYIVEQGKSRILKLDHNGKLMDTIGGKGSGDYQFSKPVDVDGTNGLKVYVTDQNNRRVQLFGRRAEYLGSIEGGNGFGLQEPFEPGQIGVGSMGEVYFEDVQSNTIRIYDLDSNPLNAFRLSAEVAEVNEIQIASDELFILDRKTETIHRLSLNGQYLGFYVADGVTAFFINEAGLWKIRKGELVLEMRGGDTRTWNIGTSLNPIDLHVAKGVAYILTSDKLMNLSVSN